MKLKKEKLIIIDEKFIIIIICICYMQLLPDSRQINKQTNLQCNEQQPEVESADDDNNDYDENENENIIECEKQKLSQKFIKIHQSK